MSDGTACLTCHTWYATSWRRPGARCGDLSQGQRPPRGCDGRVIAWPPAADRRTLDRLAVARVCFVCLTPIAPAGLYHVDLGLLVYAGACDERVSAHRRTYQWSARGRWRPARTVLASLAAARGDAGPPAGDALERMWALEARA